MSKEKTISIIKPDAVKKNVIGSGSKSPSDMNPDPGCFLTPAHYLTDSTPFLVPLLL